MKTEYALKRYSIVCACVLTASIAAYGQDTPTANAPGAANRIAPTAQGSVDVTERTPEMRSKSLENGVELPDCDAERADLEVEKARRWG